jgi:T5SS/PEP-CTERM-associated repeat protein/autotransporter-associated beta strand protein
VIENGGTAQAAGVNGVYNVSIGGGSTLQVLPGTDSAFDANQLYLGISEVGTYALGAQSDSATNDIYAGYAAGATGVVTMDNAYLSPFTTYIGYAGSGTFVLTNGSTLQSTTGYVGYSAGSQGTVQLTDSTWKAEDQSLPAPITVGAQGSGTVEADNSLISTSLFTLGDSAGSNGTVTLNSGTLTVKEKIQVGNAGTGELTLTGGATASSYGVDLGVLADSTGSLTVTASTLTSQETIHVGLSGNGTLETNGAQLHAPELFVGKNAGSTGTATISGGSLTLTAEHTGELHVGAQGHGTFTLQDGGVLTTHKGNMGYSSGAAGTVNILSGTWNNTQAIFVGVSGTGTLTTGTDSVITSESGYLAQEAAGTGSVTMNGGQWVMTNTLVVGVNGAGQFSASDAAAVSSEWAQIGLNDGSTGHVALDNALWTTTNTLTIGSDGNGEFHALNGSVVTAGLIELAASGSVAGLLEVTDSWLITDVISAYGSGSPSFSGATVKLLGGATVTDTLLLSGFASGNAVIGNGGLTIDTQGGNAQIASALSGSGSLTKTGAGRLRLIGNNTSSGGANVEAGLLQISSGGALGTGVKRSAGANCRPSRA